MLAHSVDSSFFLVLRARHARAFAALPRCLSLLALSGLLAACGGGGGGGGGGGDGGGNPAPTLTPGVDLVASGFSVTPTSAPAGTNIMLQVTVANRGMEDSQAATVTFYYSTDMDVDAMDSVLAVVPVASVASNGQVMPTASTPVSFPTGSYLGACVTTTLTGASTDTNAANNCVSGSDPFTVEAEMIDLAVSDFSVMPGQALPGTNIMLQVTVANEGTAASQMSTVTFYYSTDATIDDTDNELVAVAVAPVAAGAEVMPTASTPVNFPPGGFLGACVTTTDMGAGVDTEAANNCTMGTAFTVEMPTLTPGVDLEVRAFTVTPMSAPADANVMLQATVANRGMDASQPATVTFYYSDDAEVDAMDNVLVAVGVGTVASDGQAMAMASTPVSFPTGSFLGACVTTTDMGAGMDTDSSNNCLEGSSAFMVETTDLAVSDFLVTPGQAPAGTDIMLRVTVANEGMAASQAATVTFYYSTDTTISDADSVLATTVVTAVASGAPVMAMATTPANFPDTRARFLGACVTTAEMGARMDTDSSNNCTMGSAFTVQTTDLAVSGFSVTPSQALPEADIMLRVTVANEGMAASQAATVTFYYSVDETISDSDSVLATTVVNAVASGAPVVAMATTLVNFPVGSFLGACVTTADTGARMDTDSSNNCTMGSAFTVETFVDLASSDFMVTPSQARPGADIMLQVTVTNEGSAASQMSTVTFYHSDDPTVDTLDSVLAVEEVASLAPGAMETAMATTPVSFPTGRYLGACVTTADMGAGVDTDFSNNCVTGPAFTVEMGVDLAVGNFQLDPGAYTLGSDLIFLAVVANEGTRESLEVTLTLYYSDDATIEATDTQVYMTSRGTLRPGAESESLETVTAQAVMDSGLMAGNFYLGVCVTTVSSGASEDVNPANNCTAGSAITVVANPDDPDGDGVMNAQDVDDDNNGLIEIATLEELHNMRHTLDGSGYRTSAGGALNTMGAPTDEPRNCDDRNENTTRNLCGYELANSLDFDGSDSDSTTWTVGGNGIATLDSDDNQGTYFPVASGGWEPIGNSSNRFTGIFDGNGFAIHNLAVIRDQQEIGFFGSLGPGSQVRNLGLARPLMSNTLDAEQGRSWLRMGALTAILPGDAEILTSYVTQARVAFLWDSTFDRNAYVGLLAGLTEGNARILASYAAGDGFMRLRSYPNTVGVGLSQATRGEMFAFHFGGLAAGPEGIAHGNYANWNMSFGNNSAYTFNAITAFSVADLAAPPDHSSVASFRNAASYAAGRVDFRQLNGVVDGQAGVETLRRRFQRLTAVSVEDSTNHSYTELLGESVVEVSGSVRSAHSSPHDLTDDNTDASWNSSDSLTLNLWDFGDATQPPAIRYADYDGPGDDIRCDMFPMAAQAACEADSGWVLLPGQRDAAIPPAPSSVSSAAPPGPAPQLSFAAGDSAAHVTAAVGLPDAASDGAALAWSIERDAANLASLQGSTLAVRRPASDAGPAAVTLRADYANGAHRLIQLTLPPAQ